MKLIASFPWWWWRSRDAWLQFSKYQIAKAAYISCIAAPFKNNGSAMQGLAAIQLPVNINCYVSTGSTYFALRFSVFFVLSDLSRYNGCPGSSALSAGFCETAASFTANVSFLIPVWNIESNIFFSINFLKEAVHTCNWSGAVHIIIAKDEDFFMVFYCIYDPEYCFVHILH